METNNQHTRIQTICRVQPALTNFKSFSSSQFLWYLN